MNFLADENLDRQIVERLRQDGHTVLYVAEMAPGISDDVDLLSANAYKPPVRLVTMPGPAPFVQRARGEGFIMSHDEMGIDLAYQVHHHTDHNQQGHSAEKKGQSQSAG